MRSEQTEMRKENRLKTVCPIANEFLAPMFTEINEAIEFSCDRSQFRAKIRFISGE